MNIRSLSRLLGIAALAAAMPLVISAASTVVAEGTSGLRVTVDDLNADALRLPAAARSQALQRPDSVQQAAMNLYIRRVLASEAVRDGLDKDPTTAALLQIARERILSDARLAKIDESNKPSEGAIEAGARSAYHANPEKFRTGDQTRARYILVMGNTDKGEAVAQKLLDELKAGADFATLAKARSNDYGTAERGGDLGWFEAGKVAPELYEELAKLKKPGEMTGLIKNDMGWHILKLEGRRPAGVRTYEEVRDELRATVANQLHSDVRLREARRISETFKPDRPAIEAFSAAHRK